MTPQHITPRIAYGQIAGIVSAVPMLTVSNDDMPDPDGAHRAARNTGVVERRWCFDGQTGADLCVAAASKLLEDMHWAPESIDTLVYVTQTGSLAMPADAFVIAARLGLDERCVIMQTSWACSGYVMGLYATLRVMDGMRALLLVGDATSRECDPRDRATAPLFGDAGSATAIVPSGRVTDFWIGQDGSRAHALQRKNGKRMEMAGLGVAAFALGTVPALIQAMTDGTERRPDWWALHQANATILQQIVRRGGIDAEFEAGRVPVNIARFGNTAGASIPLLMTTDEAMRAALLDGPRQNVGMVGFGAGLSWAGARMDVGPLRVCDMIEVAP